jgi:dipeptidyl aminopeptidase/acylaminoacyl peptidase
VKYLAKRSYVDAKRMGLQGHGFGGFETNYIITHSNLFAAAMSASGVTDFVSAYGSIIGDGSSRQRQYELYRDRIGASLWERPDLYIENSPVFWADRVTTPLLMMTNYNDGDVPCQQGIEFFTALRWLGKKAWMLQYDGEGHQIYSKTAQEDLTIRMAQFFEYYLKGEPPPKWMTIGVPAKLKGIDIGLEIDESGVKP